MWSRCHLRLARCWLVVYSKWYFNWGNDLLPKKDGTPYNTEKGAFRGHPCTIWAAQNIYNTAWLIQHGFGLLEEYTHRYGKIHSCQTAMNEAEKIFEIKTGNVYNKKATPFAFAGYQLTTSLMSSSMMQASIYSLSTKDILHQNLGQHLIIFVTHLRNLVGYETYSI